MKILFVFPHFLTPGGAANAVTLLAKELSKNKIECRFLCAQVSNEFIKDNPSLKIESLNIPVKEYRGKGVKKIAPSYILNI